MKPRIGFGHSLQTLNFGNLAPELNGSIYASERPRKASSVLFFSLFFFFSSSSSFFFSLLLRSEVKIQQPRSYDRALMQIPKPLFISIARKTSWRETHP